MEKRAGIVIEKWSDVGIEPDVGSRLPQEGDPNVLGNVRRGLEDQLEQNDNMIGDGVINNVASDDKNVDGHPDGMADGSVIEKDIAKESRETVAEREERTSVIRQLHDAMPNTEPEKRPYIPYPELVL